MDKTCALVLAAGDGKRMKSRHPKVLCEVLFKPMLSWVIDSCRLAEIEELCVVVAPDADEVRAVLPEGCRTAEQAEKLGTGLSGGAPGLFSAGAVRRRAFCG